MTERLNRIYTGGGDQGQTSLADGSRVAKDDARIRVMGHLDELNAYLGVLLTHAMPASEQTLLQGVQMDLFELGSEMAVPGRKGLRDADVDKLEKALDALNADLPALREFLLPGGSSLAAQTHIARAVCRRAERSLVSLQRLEDINSASLRYLNRLSDLLFVLARHFNRISNTPEQLFSGFRPPA